MTIAYTIFDPNRGDILFSVALAASLAAAPVASITITGGTINGAVIGGTAPAAGSFTALNASGKSNLHTTQVSTITSTGLAVLPTTQIGLLSVTQIAGTGSYVANGVTGTSVTVGGLTTTGVVGFGLHTAGGTVGTPHLLFPPNPTSGQVVCASTVGDTSTYNVSWTG